MSPFEKCFSQTHFPSHCLFLERAVNFTICLSYNKDVSSPFFAKLSDQRQFCKSDHKKGVLKKLGKIHRITSFLESPFY